MLYKKTRLQYWIASLGREECVEESCTQSLVNTPLKNVCIYEQEYVCTQLLYKKQKRKTKS